jgi:hypothetical protein
LRKRVGADTIRSAEHSPSVRRVGLLGVPFRKFAGFLVACVRNSRPRIGTNVRSWCSWRQNESWALGRFVPSSQRRSASILIGSTQSACSSIVPPGQRAIEEAQVGSLFAIRGEGPASDSTGPRCHPHSTGNTWEHEAEIGPPGSVPPSGRVHVSSFSSRGA